MTRKAPYKFESISLLRRVTCELILGESALSGSVMDYALPRADSLPSRHFVGASEKVTRFFEMRAGLLLHRSMPSRGSRTSVEQHKLGPFEPIRAKVRELAAQCRPRKPMRRTMDPSNVIEPERASPACHL